MNANGRSLLSITHTNTYAYTHLELAECFPSVLLLLLCGLDEGTEAVIISWTRGWDSHQLLVIEGFDPVAHMRW